MYLQSMLPVMITHTPAGTSLKAFFHYSQGVKNKKFSYYDYGYEQNILIYNSTVPPDYDLSAVNLPVAIFYAENDYLADPLVSFLLIY